MAKKEKRSQSALGTFGSIVIALGLLLGFIRSDIYIAAAGISAGIFILLIACLADRLDIIIDLLRQIGEAVIPDEETAIDENNNEQK